MSIFALVDCNNFYASCQRIFNPSLENQPVVVLSNNDGCIIARSNQAKKLGIPMGAPYFQYEEFCRKNNVAVFSSNYALYGDISQRVMSSLRHFCADIEVYSIDEAFLRFDSNDPADIFNWCKMIRSKIKMWTGIPVSIGISTTKTLAKVANSIAKKLDSDSVFDLSATKLQDSLLAEIQVSKIWGIGSRLAKTLSKMGIHQAQQLRDSSDSWIRQHFGVTVQRTVLELRGIACLNLAEAKHRKNIISSRSFNQPIQKFEDLEPVLSEFVAIAGTKLRRQKSKAQGIYVFLQTNLFDASAKPYSNGIFCSFVEPSSDTGLMIKIAKNNLKKIYLPGLNYKKMGVILADLLPFANKQYDLFIHSDSQGKKDQVMKTLDDINNRMGRASIYLAAQGRRETLPLKFHRKSPCYTTHWQDILTVHV
ncbi:MAG: Y-family DNA polymerase [Proteobacteria bacterium]|nr:Y-family DNA polymerase [Pseudomonadota bacterium]